MLETGFSGTVWISGTRSHSYLTLPSLIKAVILDKENLAKKPFFFLKYQYYKIFSFLEKLSKIGLEMYFSLQILF